MPLEKLEFFSAVLEDLHELKKFVHSIQCKKSLNAYHLQVGPSCFPQRETKVDQYVHNFVEERFCSQLTFKSS